MKKAKRKQSLRNVRPGDIVFFHVAAVFVFIVSNDGHSVTYIIRSIENGGVIMRTCSVNVFDIMISPFDVTVIKRPT